MIISSQVVEEKDDKEAYHDYIACLYPEGVIYSNYYYIFDDDDVEQIVHYGPVTDKEYKARLIAQNVLNKKVYGPYKNK